MNGTGRERFGGFEEGKINVGWSHPACAWVRAGVDLRMAHNLDRVWIWVKKS